MRLQSMLFMPDLSTLWNTTYKEPYMHKIFTLLLLSATLVSCNGRQTTIATASPVERQLPQVSFSSDSAYAYVGRQVAFGPRVPGTASHAACLKYLVSEMSRYAQVDIQEGEGLAYDGSHEKIYNVIAHIAPEKNNRIMLSAHWDCRPFSDHDPDPSKRDMPVDGANDGASGVGILIEVARQLSLVPANVGVDIIFFDCEDGGTPDHKKVEYRPDTWCVGSQFWSKSNMAQDARYRFGILLDMVGAPNAIFPVELYSKNYASDVVEKIWRTAERLGYGHTFVRDDGGYITDDHYYINKFAQIPTADIIHYDPSSAVGFCSAWHTTSDNLSNISKETLQMVGETILSVVYMEK